MTHAEQVVKWAIEQTCAYLVDSGIETENGMKPAQEPRREFRQGTAEAAHKRKMYNEASMSFLKIICVLYSGTHARVIGYGRRRYNNERANDVIIRAKNGDCIADAVLRELAADMSKSGEPLPTNLHAYIKTERPPRKRGRKGYSNALRDFRIARAVEYVCGLGFKPTRGEDKRAVVNAKGASACWIVAEALRRRGLANVSETAIEKIWQRFDARHDEKFYNEKFWQSLRPARLS
jgi:hypothetical protein